MSLEDRLRAAFRAGEPSGPAPEGAWNAIEERAEARSRRRRRVRWGAWLAPVIVVAAGVPAFEGLTPGGHRAQVVVTTPSPASSVTAPAPIASPGVPTTLPVKSCHVTEGVPGTPYPAIPPTVTAAVPPGMSLAAYGGPLVILGPPGWDCEGTLGADAHERTVAFQPGTSVPDNFISQTTQTVEAVIGDMPSLGTGGPVGLVCPFFPAAKAAETAQGIPCPGPPPGENVSAVDSSRVTFEDGPRVAGTGIFSGGPNPAVAEAFFDPQTTAAGLATCVVAASEASVCGPVLADFTARYGPPPPASVVPWAALPLKPDASLFQTPPPAPASGAPPCTAAQLRGQAGPASSGGTQFMVRQVTFTNISSAPCLLSGSPTSLVGVRSSGQTVDLKPDYHLPLDGAAAGVLVPGAVGVMRLGGSILCTTPGETVLLPGIFASVRIGIPGGGTVSAAPPSGTDANDELSFPCWATVSPLGVPGPVAPYETAAFQDLRIAISAPPTAVAGATLHYRVTLSNPTDATIALDPCPGYVLGFGPSSTPSAPRPPPAPQSTPQSTPERFYQLNCGQAKPIPAGGEESFAMELAVPPSEQGEVTLNLAFASTPDAHTPPRLIGPNMLRDPAHLTVVAPA